MNPISSLSITALLTIGTWIAGMALAYAGKILNRRQARKIEVRITSQRRTRK